MGKFWEENLPYSDETFIAKRPFMRRYLLFPATCLSFVTSLLVTGFSTQNFAGAFYMQSAKRLVLNKITPPPTPFRSNMAREIIIKGYRKEREVIERIRGDPGFIISLPRAKNEMQDKNPDHASLNAVPGAGSGLCPVCKKIQQ